MCALLLGIAHCISDRFHLCTVFCELNCKWRSRKLTLKSEFTEKKNKHIQNLTHAYAAAPQEVDLNLFEWGGGLWRREKRIEGDRNVERKREIGIIRDTVNRFQFSI